MNTENNIIGFFQKIKKNYDSYQNKHKKSLKTFFYKANFEYKLYKKVKREVDKYLSTDFNLIGIFQPDENKISDLIVNLLEPKGKHGQEDKFLNLFLEHLKKIWKKGKDLYIDSDKVEIEREAFTTSGRRIDILMEFINLVIGIENKPWAGEKYEQLDDYFNFLKQKNRDFLLIFLPGTKREPVSISEENKKSGNFINISYNELLLPWLEDCYKNCESQKVRFFIKDSVEWLKENFKELKED